MIQPQGYIDKRFPDYVCKLRKSLYGLKQVPRAWYQKLSTFLISIGFHGSTADSSLFIYQHGTITCFLLIYVDDIILTGSHSFFLNEVITKLSTAFSLRDLGSLSYFLGIQICRLL